YGFQADTWIDPKTLADPIAPTYQDPQQGGQPRVLGGRGIGYQKRLPGDFEVEGWNTAEVIARGDTTTHLLNGRVVNQANNIRFGDPDKGEPKRSITRGRLALEIEAAEIFFRNIELRRLDGPAAATAKR